MEINKKVLRKEARDIFKKYYMKKIASALLADAIRTREILKENKYIR